MLNIQNLHELERGVEAVLYDFQHMNEESQRVFWQQGLFPGITIRVGACALTDPCVYEIGGRKIALRLDDARCIRVQIPSSSGE